MSILFNDASSQYADAATPAATAVPLTMVAWAYIDDLSIDQTIMSIAHAAGTLNYFALQVIGTGSNQVRAAISATTGGPASADSTAGLTANTWHHVLAEFSALGARAAELDGANRGTGVGDRTPVSNFLTDTAIGRLSTSSPSGYVSGRVAEAAIYAGVLTTADKEALAAGVSPLLIRPDILTRYWPMGSYGVINPLGDVVGGLSLTLNAGPVEADHPPVALADSLGILNTSGFSPGEIAMLGEAFAALALSVSKPSQALGEAFTAGQIAVTMTANNPPLAGDLVDIGNNAVFQLKVNGDLLDFTQVESCFHAFNMGSLDVSYDGKELNFFEFTGIGSATYAPEQDVTLEIDFSDGLGLSRLFSGRIKQRDHEGRNNNEMISYTAIDYLQLADDLTAVGSNGYPQITWTAPSTVTSITSVFGSFVNSLIFTNGQVPISEIAPTPIKQAVQEYFAFNSANLASIGIPTAIGAPGLEQFTAELPETVTLDSVGFSAGLISLSNYQTGVKVLFDEKQQAWIFPNLQTVPTVIVDVASTNIPELPFSVDTTDRFTAVRLFADITDENGLDDLVREKTEIVSLGGGLGFGRIERSEVALTPMWLKDLELKWTMFKALYSNPAQIEGQNYFVYRRFALPENTERPGFGLKAQAYAKYNQWGEEFWAPLDGHVYWDQNYFLADYPALNRGNPWHPGHALPASDVKLGYIPTDLRYIPATSITSGGTPVFSGVATTAQRQDFSDEIRYPITGFEGTAFTDFGVAREFVQVTDRTQVTIENAKAIHDLRKDVVISGEVPIEGDPIPELITLGIKCLVTHPTKSTGIETFPAFVTNYSYEFGKRGQSTISLSTDIAGLIR